MGSQKYHHQNVESSWDIDCIVLCSILNMMLYYWCDLKNPLLWVKSAVFYFGERSSEKSCSNWIRYLHRDTYAMVKMWWEQVSFPVSLSTSSTTDGDNIHEGHAVDVALRIGGPEDYGRCPCHPFFSQCFLTVFRFICKQRSRSLSICVFMLQWQRDVISVYGYFSWFSCLNFHLPYPTPMLRLQGSSACSQVNRWSTSGHQWRPPRSWGHRWCRQ